MRVTSTHFLSNRKILKRFPRHVDLINYRDGPGPRNSILKIDVLMDTGRPKPKGLNPFH